MKSTSARYLLPLLIGAGLPIACGGSSSGDYFTPNNSVGGEGGSPDSEPGDTAGKNTGAGTAGKSGKPDGEGGEGGTTGVGGKGPLGGTGGTSVVVIVEGGSAGAVEAGGAGPGEGGSAGSGEAGAGGEGGAVIVLHGALLDPNQDGAPDASSGRYRLHHHSTQKCLSLESSKASVATCDASPAERFFLDGAAGGTKVFVRQVDGECVAMVGKTVFEHSCVSEAALTIVPVGGGYFQLKNDAGVCLGVSKGAVAGVTCSEDDEWSLDALGTNVALKALYSATSTFPGYSLNYVHDGDRNTGLEGHSWANNWAPPSLTLPQEVIVDFQTKRQISMIDLLSSTGYVIGSYDIDYWNGADWIKLKVVQGNVSLDTIHVFNTIATSKLKLTMRRGPENQFIYTRINELEIY